jgi:hypothetical protein
MRTGQAIQRGNRRKEKFVVAENGGRGPIRTGVHSGGLPDTKQQGQRSSVHPGRHKGRSILEINVDDEDRQARPVGKPPLSLCVNEVKYHICNVRWERDCQLLYLSKNILLKDRFSP